MYKKLISIRHFGNWIPSYHTYGANAGYTEIDCIKVLGLNFFFKQLEMAQ